MASYDYSEYTLKDICNELFMLTDALRDNGDLEAESEDLDALRKRFYEICMAVRKNEGV